jgi:hypothetical protein
VLIRGEQRRGEGRVGEGRRGEERRGDVVIKLFVMWCRVLEREQFLVCYWALLEILEEDSGEIYEAVWEQLRSGRRWDRKNDAKGWY